jgi:molybdopterin/thiamine biosynthesis adenylyltransferase
MLETELLNLEDMVTDAAAGALPSYRGSELAGSSLRGARVLVAGAGNVGSPAIRLLARCGVSLLRIVDRDGVETKNLATQDYRPWEVGQHKAHVLGRRIREDCPGVKVETYAADLEDLPIGLLHDLDMVVGALDSRRGRQALSLEMAWPQGIPIIDGGVGVADGLVGRVQVFQPGPESACLECGFSVEDYKLLAREYPCVSGENPVLPPTGAPAYLGAALASLLVAEAARVFNGQTLAPSYEVAFDLWNCRILRSRLLRSARCRFDHVVIGRFISLGRPFLLATLADLMATVERAYPGQAVDLECRRGLQLAGQSWRVIPAAALLGRGAEPLVALGLTPLDRVRIRTEDGTDGFVVLDDPAQLHEEFR